MPCFVSCGPLPPPHTDSRGPYQPVSRPSNLLAHPEMAVPAITNILQATSAKTTAGTRRGSEQGAKTHEFLRSGLIVHKSRRALGKASLALLCVFAGTAMPEKRRHQRDEETDNSADSEVFNDGTYTSNDAFMTDTKASPPVDPMPSYGHYPPQETMDLNSFSLIVLEDADVNSREVFTTLLILDDIGFTSNKEDFLQPALETIILVYVRTAVTPNAK